jgi:hypothetical protein
MKLIDSFPFLGQFIDSFHIFSVDRSAKARIPLTPSPISSFLLNQSKFVIEEHQLAIAPSVYESFAAFIAELLNDTLRDLSSLSALSDSYDSRVWFTRR